MRYVLDASVVVAAVRPSEPHHLAARARLLSLFTGQDEVVIPAIFDAEVTSALVRGGAPPTICAAYIDSDFAARRMITLGPCASRGVVAIVHATKLRAADASNVWVAFLRGLSL
jgi:predicted nucleic acid-binding protein